MAKRIIALDYGTKRIGVARSDAMQWFAEPVDAMNEDDLFVYLKKMDESDVIELFLVGYPLSYNDSENRATKRVNTFIKKLQKEFPSARIETTDEYNSSNQANEFLIEQGVSRNQRKKKGRLDITVASLMLNDYLLSKN